MGKRNKIKRAIIAAGLCLLLLAGIFYAARQAKITFENNLQTGSTHIDITTYKVEDGIVVETPPEDIRAVYRNETVSYIPRVTNLRYEGYVRVKIDIEEKDIDESGFSDFILKDDIKNSRGENGANPDWIQKPDGFFYCTKVLSPGEYSEIFNQLRMERWLGSPESKTLNVHMIADVIQTDHFTPNWEEDLPWGGVQIERAKERDDIDYGEARSIGDKALIMTYDGTRLEGTSADLFDNFGEFYMAGNTYSDVLKMKNASRGDVKLYFRTQNVNTDLLEQMELRILLNGTEIYSGDLVSEELSPWRELTVLKRGETKDFEFEVHLPKESQNYYSVLKDKVIWQFDFESMGGKQTGQELPIHLIILIAIAIFSALWLLAGRKRDF